MQRRFLVLFSVFWLCLLVYGVVQFRRHSVAVAPANPETATAAVEPEDEEAKQKALADEEKQTQDQCQALADVETRRSLLDKAASHTHEARRQWQLARADAWSSFLSVNSQAFANLRRQSEVSPDGNAHCTICDGHGTLGFCVLCENSSKCPSCKGTGKGLGDEICPTCIGGGKCYLCSGSGRMPCLYCDDGTISRKGPLPLRSLPLQCDPVTADQIVVADATGSDLEDASEKELQTPDREHEPSVAALPPAHDSRNGLALAVGLLLAGTILALRKTVGPDWRFSIRNPGPSGKARPPSAADRPAAAVACAVMAEPVPVAAFPEREINPAASSPANGHEVPALVKPFGDDPEAPFTHTLVHLEKLRNLLQAAKRAAEPGELQEFLGELFVGVHSLVLEAEQAELVTVSRLSSALEGMLKKLLENTELCTPSTLNTAGTALDLLDDLCWTGCDPDLADPPVRLLVVDDDPVARRAVCGSLQLAFGRPESAESGEAGFALAAEKSFDLIFLDMLMPGIDGFTTCRKIRETHLNVDTPVVFITGYDDIHSRTQAAVSGGCGLIPKPVLASQITLTALTFILRARLNQPAPAMVPEEAACLELA